MKKTLNSLLIVLAASLICGCNSPTQGRLNVEPEKQGISINEDSLDKNSVLFIISPSLAYSEQEINSIIKFVELGGKVIITGEWGGYSNFNCDSVNHLLDRANLKINQDLVKESVEHRFQN